MCLSLCSCHEPAPATQKKQQKFNWHCLFGFSGCIKRHLKCKRAMHGEMHLGPPVPRSCDCHCCLKGAVCCLSTVLLAKLIMSINGWLLKVTTHV